MVIDCAGLQYRFLMSSDVYEQEGFIGMSRIHSS